MRVSIILPPAGSQPVGGYAVQYCFADQLALIGDVPTIVHPLRLGRPSRTELRGEACSFARATRRGGRLIPWHKFDRGVKLRFVPWLAPAFLPRADVTVLTAYETAAAHGPRTRRSGPLVQVVFDYEFWVEGDAATREAISAALSRPDVTHIAGSSAVREMLESMGVTPVATIPPGIDPDRFHCRTPPSQRPVTIGFSFRTAPHKGMGDLIPALERVRAVRPEVAISCFGPTWDAPPLPPWVESLGYLTDEELVDFYDRCSIFVLPSHHEGWGLPAVEAMACGAAVVTTDCGGTRDFAQNEVNALVVGAGDVEGLFQAIIRLVDDAGLRTRLATAGPGVLASVSWDASAARTRRVLQEAMGGKPRP